MKQLPKLVFGAVNRKVIVSELSSVRCNQAKVILGKLAMKSTCNSEGKKNELNRTKFTADATEARKESRLDYFRGDDGSFFFCRTANFSVIKFSLIPVFQDWFRKSSGNQFFSIAIKRRKPVCARDEPTFIYISV